MASSIRKKEARVALKSSTAELPNGVPPKAVKKGARPERVIEARYVRTSQLFLRFADGLEGTWSFRQLRLDMSNMKLTSIKASASGHVIDVKSKWGDDVQLDTSSLRALVDPDYAAAVEIKLDALARKIGL